MTDTMTTKKPRKKKEPYPFPVELIDQLLAQVQNKDAESILGESGLAGQLKKMLAERMLAAELTHHLANEDTTSKNHRNGTTPKKVLAPGGELHLDIPRDRLSSFEPQLVAKGQRRMPGFDDQVISMYARGMSVREIQGHLLELYGTEVSPMLISTITDEVIEEVEVEVDLIESPEGTDEDIDAFAAEMRDRFGVLPDEVRYLFKVAAIKAYCRRANVGKVDAGPKGAVIAFRDNSFAHPERLVTFIRQHGRAAKVRPDMKVVFFQEWDTPEERLAGTTEILRQLANLAESKKAA